MSMMVRLEVIVQLEEEDRMAAQLVTKLQYQPDSGTAQESLDLTTICARGEIMSGKVIETWPSYTP